jgi:molybdopterin-synthase adenylyltransferase
LTELTDDQLDRYARHIVLRDIGGAGQVRIMNGHVLMVGAGGIGCPALQYLAAAGVGRITLIDDDDVALSNLQRQVLFTPDDIGKPKVDVAMQFVARLNPDVRMTTHNHRLTKDTPDTLFDGVDIIIDGSDSFATRLTVNDFAVKHKIPLVSSAIGMFQGQLGTFCGWEADAPCYRCFVGDAHDPDDCDSCAELGVLGAMVGVMGTLAAMEALRVLTGFGSAQKGKLQVIDGLSLTMRGMTLPKDPECSTCGFKPEL